MQASFLPHSLYVMRVWTVPRPGVCAFRKLGPIMRWKNHCLDLVAFPSAVKVLQITGTKEPFPSGNSPRSPVPLADAGRPDRQGNEVSRQDACLHGRPSGRRARCAPPPSGRVLAHVLREDSDGKNRSHHHSGRRLWSHPHHLWSHQYVTLPSLLNVANASQTSTRPRPSRVCNLHIVRLVGYRMTRAPTGLLSCTIGTGMAPTPRYLMVARSSTI